MPVLIYLLVVTKIGWIDKTFESIQKVTHTECRKVTGPYDIVFEANAENDAHAVRIIQHVKDIDGVLSITSLASYD